jgi:Uma2 family endonuclease
LFSRQRLPTGLPAGYVGVAPELIVEIMLPSERWSDLETKIAEYFAIGVERVWMVLPRARAVFVYHAPTAWQRLGEDAILQSEGVLAGFALPVAHLFAL